MNMNKMSTKAKRQYTHDTFSPSPETHIWDNDVVAPLCGYKNRREHVSFAYDEDATCEACVLLKFAKKAKKAEKSN